MISQISTGKKYVTATLMVAMLGSSICPSFADFATKHPRRAEVLSRDKNINRRINADKGDLSGHYGQLKREDHAIKRQEQAEARFNGGHITRGEKRQLNREEHAVNRQIKRDSY